MHLVPGYAAKLPSRRELQDWVLAGCCGFCEDTGEVIEADLLGDASSGEQLVLSIKLNAGQDGRRLLARGRLQKLSHCLQQGRGLRACNKLQQLCVSTRAARTRKQISHYQAAINHQTPEASA